MLNMLVLLNCSKLLKYSYQPTKQHMQLIYSSYSLLLSLCSLHKEMIDLKLERNRNNLIKLIQLVSD